MHFSESKFEGLMAETLKLNKGDNMVTLVFDNDNNGKLNVDSIAIK